MRAFTLKKRLPIFGFISVLFTLLSYNAFCNENTAFLKGNEFYNKGEYSSAIQEYSKVIDSGVSSVELYYNLANSYYKNQQIAKAILFYEKARILAPGDENINYNLDLARSHTVDKINEVPQFFIRTWFYEFKNIFSSNQWAINALILFFISLTSLFIFYISGRSIIKKIFFWSGVFIFLTAFLSMANSISLAREIKKHAYAIIINPTVTVKSSPEQSGSDLFVIHEGIKLRIVDDEVSGWYEVKLMDGNAGWIRREDVERI
jgi:tetratricopeptide (TPR) repeat protein